MNRKRKKTTLLEYVAVGLLFTGTALCWSFLLGGCVSQLEKPSSDSTVFATKPGPIKPAIRNICDQLFDNAHMRFEDTAIAVMTFVNLNDLYRTSSLGRYLSEQLITELQKKEVFVIDVRKTPGVMIREGYGEYSLSRQIEELDRSYVVEAVVVGTYTLGNDRIFINSRLLRAIDGMVLSSGSIELGLNEMTLPMLKDEMTPPPPGQTIKVRQIK